MKISSLRISLAVLLSLLCPLVLAHPSHGSGIADGLLHPLTGLDHLLAMVGVGLWSAQQSGHSRWLIPGSFVLLMGFAGWLGTLGYSLPFIESGIATSVLLIGLLISFSIKTSALFGMLMVGMFAVLHGFAHGTEMPPSVSAWQFGAGFMLTTTLLHAIGFLSGTALHKNEKLMRIGGAGIAMCGGFLVFPGLH